MRFIPMLRTALVLVPLTLAATPAAAARWELQAGQSFMDDYGANTAFVEAVSPEVVLFGAAWRSHFRHPRPEVVERYAAIGARPLTTGVEGAIRVWREPDGGVTTESWRRRVPRFWSAAPEP